MVKHWSYIARICVVAVDVPGTCYLRHVPLNGLEPDLNELAQRYEHARALSAAIAASPALDLHFFCYSGEFKSSHSSLSRSAGVTKTAA